MPITHSGKPLTWSDVVEEACGEWGIHPWELEQYSYDEFIARRKGQLRKKREEYRMVREICFWSAVGMMKKGFKRSDIFDVKDDSEEVKIPESISERVARVREKYKQAGVLK